MPGRLGILIVALVVVFAQPAQAQAMPSLPDIAFESWHPASFDHGSMPAPGRIITVAGDKKDNWLIGGALGAATGIVFCTAVSTLMNDSASRGLSFCPLDSYAIMAGAGFVLGAVIGAAF